MRHQSSIALLARGILCAAIFAPAAAHASVEITDKKNTRNMVCSAGACVANAKNATLSVKDVTSMLQAGDLKVFTGNGALNIEITAAFSWVSANRLTLNAYQSVNFRAPVTVAGPGGLTVVTDTAGNGGDLYFFGGKVSFWDTTSSLIVDGHGYTLVADIASLAGDVAANPSGFYALAKDYDAFVDGIYPHSPVPTAFAGSFSAMGNAIDRLSMNDAAIEQELGLFSEIAAGGLVSNLELTNLNVKGASVADVGGVAGANMGTIRDAVASGSIAGNQFAGGVAGSNAGLIFGSQATMDVAGLAGGALVGQNLGTIEASHSAGSVHPITGPAGGLVGYNQGAIADSSSSAAVAVSQPNAPVGGLVGYNNTGSIDRSFATGPVSLVRTERGGRPRSQRGALLGGLVGASQGRISNSYAMGSVTDAPSKQKHPRKYLNEVGGLVGELIPFGGSIMQSYATGAVSLSQGYLGGVVGRDNAEPDTKRYVYWDRDTSGVADPGKGAGNIAFDKGLKGLATDAFARKPLRGFDPAIWGQKDGINNGYPYLLANPPK